MKYVDVPRWFREVGMGRQGDKETRGQGDKGMGGWGEIIIY